MQHSRERQTAIKRLLNLLSEPQHPYRPSTEIFVDLNVDRVAEELSLPQQGRERGAQNRPPPDAQDLDDVEHKIIERVEAHKSTAYSIYLEHLQTYDERLTGLHFEQRFAVIQQSAPEAVGEFRAEAALGRDELFRLRRAVCDSEQERDDFRAHHRLNRPARTSTPGKSFLKIGLLAFLFLAEVVINGAFLAPSNAQGILGGAIQAVSFAALNILVSFFCGLVPIRLINRRSILAKLTGALSLILYLLFAIALNLTLAHLREIPPTFVGDIGREVLVRLLTAPYNLVDINSWVFFGIGLVFSVIAMTDGLLFTDPYGYGALEKRCATAHKQYTARKKELIDDLREIKDEATSAMNDAATDLSTRRSEFDSILQARSRLAQRFIVHQNQIEQASRALLARYREVNCSARTTPPPAHFSASYKLERIIYVGNQPEETARAKLQQSITESQDLLQRQVSAIHEAFEIAGRSYQEIDQLFPEEKSEPPQSKAA
jgi:hypothetical protein